MVAPPKFTLEQYFAYDGLFEFHLEYHAGRILPVEIPENRHTLILMNVTREIRRRREDEFMTLLENQRLRPVPEHYVYADLALLRDVPQYVDERVDTVLNPRAIVEVFSPSSWAHDHVTKGSLYRRTAFACRHQPAADTVRPDHLGAGCRPQRRQLGRARFPLFDRPGAARAAPELHHPG